MMTITVQLNKTIKSLKNQSNSKKFTAKPCKKNQPLKNNSTKPTINGKKNKIQKRLPKKKMIA